MRKNIVHPHLSALQIHNSAFLSIVEANSENPKWISARSFVIGIRWMVTARRRTALTPTVLMK